MLLLLLLQWRLLLLLLLRGWFERVLLLLMLLIPWRLLLLLLLLRGWLDDGRFGGGWRDGWPNCWLKCWIVRRVPARGVGGPGLSPGPAIRARPLSCDDPPGPASQVVGLAEPASRQVRERGGGVGAILRRRDKRALVCASEGG